MAKVGRGSDQFPLRLPDGLRERIKAYAEAEHQSMNTVIVGILESKFPEPISFEKRMDVLLEHVRRLAQGQSPESQLARLEIAIRTALMDVVSGRIDNVDDATRERVNSVLKLELEEQGLKQAKPERESEPEPKARAKRSR